ncbi:hypothetical protein Sjap_014325 [Stephania japonica]|uniref:Non-specific lipid-transfer protein n=1 Tax=Stephania japonica TaxID=461633 RepID=A0AAP0IZQ7_9MAGN
MYKVVVLQLLAMLSLVMVASELRGHVDAAITCADVTRSASSCILYVTGAVAGAPTTCCAGIKNLNSMATTREDRQTVCGCIKASVQKMKNLHPDRLSGLPHLCGVSIPYQLSPTMDCSR